MLFTITATHFAGSADDGYADNLSFVAQADATPPTGAPEPPTLSLVGAGLLGMRRIRRRKN